MGHGHVTPNPDGSKARCGGPAMCSKCALELAQLQRIQATGQEIADVIEEAHKAEALSPEVWEAQQQEIERLSRLVAELEGTKTLTLVRCRIEGAISTEREKASQLLKERDEKYPDYEEFRRGVMRSPGYKPYDNDGKSTPEGKSILARHGYLSGLSKKAHEHTREADAYARLLSRLFGDGVSHPETPQKPSGLPQEVPVGISGGDSATAPYTAPRLLIAWCFKESPDDVRRELHIGTTYAELKQYAGVLNETHPHLEHWVEFEGESA